MGDPEKADEGVKNGVVCIGPKEVKEEEEIEDDNIVCESTPIETTQTEIEMVSTQAYAAVRFEEVLIEVINSSTLNVDWCPLLNCDNLYGYKIRYSIKDNTSYNEVFVTPGISNFTITGLKPATEYVVCVNAIDDKESVIQQCGLATQKTDEFEGKLYRSTPYITVVVAAILLTTAIVVPLTILITAYERSNHFGAPNCTVIAGGMLLLLAIVVPVTFLFLRKCGPCSTDNKITIIKQDAEEDTVTLNYDKENKESDQISRNMTKSRSLHNVIHH